MEQQVIVSTATLAAVTEAVKGGINADKKNVVMTDLLVADGVRRAHLDLKTGHKPTCEAVKGAIRAAFPADVRRVLDADVKSLSDAQKVLRKTWQQRIGVDFSRVQKQVAKREATPEKEPKTWCQTTRAMIEAIIKRAQNAGEDVPAKLRQPELVKHLEAALKCVPAK